MWLYNREVVIHNTRDYIQRLNADKDSQMPNTFSVTPVPQLVRVQCYFIQHMFNDQRSEDMRGSPQSSLGTPCSSFTVAPLTSDMAFNASTQWL